jgi:uncharacterized protein
VACQRWLEGYVSQIITRDPTGTVGARNPALLLRYLEAYALHSAGIVEAKSIYEAAGIDKRTGASYEQVLENVFVVESLPAWKTNRLKRLVQSPKRYLLDAGLMAAVLRPDQAAILHDDKMLGRVIDTFVASQLRGEVEVCATRPRLYHLRDTDGRREADIVAELAGERVLAFAVKAGSSVTAHDARHLAWMRDQLGDRFISGVVSTPGRTHSRSATGLGRSRSALSGPRRRPTAGPVPRAAAALGAPVPLRRPRRAMAPVIREARTRSG